MAEQTYDAVCGYFPTGDSAEAAVRALRGAGFTLDHISIAGAPEENQKATLDERGEPDEERHKFGGAFGGFWKRVRDIFEGEAAEPFAALNTRLDLATHDVGSTYNYDPDEFRLSLGPDVPEERSRYVSQQYSRTGRGVLVTVHAGERLSEAEAILEENGADLYGNTTADLAQLGAADGHGDTAQRRIQLYGNVLRVHRERVQRGELPRHSQEHPPLRKAS